MSKRFHKKRNIEVASEVTDEVTDETAEELTNEAEEAEVMAEEAVEDSEESIAEASEAAEDAAEVISEADSVEDGLEDGISEEESSEESSEEEASEEDAKDSIEDTDEPSEKVSEKAEEVKKTPAPETDIRKEAARVAKNKHERDKANAINEVDEKREARRQRRVRNQVISYIVVVALVLILVAAGVFAFLKFGRKAPAQPTADNVIPVTEPSEQTEDIINDMLGMEDDISEPVVEPTVEPEPEPEPDLLGEYVDSLIADMTLEDKVAGLFMVTPESITGATVATIAGDATSRALEKYAVGGIIYSDKNVSNKDQFSTLIEKTASMVKYPTFFAFAEEGGDVGSLAKAGFYTAESSAAGIAGTEDVTNAYSAGVSIGFAMSSIGLNVNLAPVADLSVAGDNVLGNRIYADNAGDVLAYANEMMRGLEDGEVNACLKYFPGLGMVNTDPAKGRVVSERTDEDFTNNEFYIYQTLIDNGANMVMMSNVVYSAYSDIPASLSEEVVTDILRSRLGFTGVVISGNLSDMAVSQYYGADEAAIAALKAGCDMLLCPEDFEAAYNGIIKAVNDGVIDEKRIDNALERILRVKYAEYYE